LRGADTARARADYRDALRPAPVRPADGRIEAALVDRLRRHKCVIGEGRSMDGAKALSRTPGLNRVCITSADPESPVPITQSYFCPCLSCSPTGRLAASHPPPSALMSATAAVSRWPRRPTAVRSLFNWAACTTATLRKLAVPALYWLLVMVTDSRAALTARSCTSASSFSIRSAARLSSTSRNPVRTVCR